jgi:hypothetical protein
MGTSYRSVEMPLITRQHASPEGCIFRLVMFSPRQTNAAEVRTT